MKKFLLLMISAAVLLSVSCKNEKKTVLNVYNWGDYIDEEILNIFEKETGLKVNYQTYAVNEDMYIKVKQGGSNFDVLFPSDYMVTKMTQEGMLEKLDTSLLPNIKYINPEFMNKNYDPGNKYSLPYFWGTLGILYNKKTVKEPVTSWDILWDEKYKDNILMYDSMRDAVGIALMKKGYSMNTTDIKELEEAGNLLKEQKKIIRAYVEDIIKDMMINEEAAIATVWSCDAAIAMDANENLAYAVPEGAVNIWVDCSVIPSNAKNKKEAHMFINFLNRPEIALRNVEYVLNSTPNTGAYELLDDKTKNDEVLYPKQEILEKAEAFIDLGSFTEEYDKVFTEVKIY